MFCDPDLSNNQGRINHGAKRAMAQGPRRKGTPAPPRKKF